MGYKVVTLQNKSEWDIEKPTICIHQGDPEWEEAIAAWRMGKPPTTSKDWKKGVFAITKEVEKCYWIEKNLGMVCLIGTIILALFAVALYKMLTI